MGEKFWSTVIFVLTILYVLSPIDLIPDVIPFAGNADDLIAMYAGMSKFIRSRPLA